MQRCKGAKHCSNHFILLKWSWAFGRTPKPCIRLILEHFLAPTPSWQELHLVPSSFLLPLLHLLRYYSFYLVHLSVVQVVCAVWSGGIFWEILDFWLVGRNSVARICCVVVEIERRPIKQKTNNNNNNNDNYRSKQSKKKRKWRIKAEYSKNKLVKRTFKLTLNLIKWNKSLMPSLWMVPAPLTDENGASCFHVIGPHRILVIAYEISLELNWL